MGSPGKSGVRRSRQGAVIKLSADLNMDGIRALHAELLAAVGKPGVVTLDAGAVARVHGAAMQLFCSFFRDRTRGGHDTRWSHPTEALRSAASVLGLTEVIQLPQEAA